MFFSSQPSPNLGHRCDKRNSKIPNGQTEIVKSEDRQDHGRQNETKDKHRKHKKRTLQKPIKRHKNKL